MNKGITKILALIALILQAIAVTAGIGIVIMQKTLVSSLMVRTSDTVRPVIPVTLLFMALQLVIYVAFFNISKNEGNKPLVVVLVVVSVVLSVLSVVGNAAGSFYYSRVGVEAVAVYSSVTTLVSYANTLFGIPAAPLFYLSCGRYTAG
ncbi:MAG: hypothetical protein K6E63_01160 [Lachnospiraceae bacterium]|nr:hypothetical protein [Lachnospiraceae bacterium]